MHAFDLGISKKGNKQIISRGWKPCPADKCIIPMNLSGLFLGLRLRIINKVVLKAAGGALMAGDPE
jgi:hypothetical protein